MSRDDDIYRSERRRVFAESLVPRGVAEVALSEDNAHYLHRVLRLSEGDEVELADGSGKLYAGKLRLAEEPGLEGLRVVAEAPVFPRRTLLCGLIKGQRWEWMIEKAGELGADRVVPVRAARSVVDVPEKKVAKRVERWQKIADSAARQCERLGRLEVLAPMSLKAALVASTGDTLVTLDETRPLRSWSSVDIAAPLAFAVGPEGGWTDEERALLTAAGAQAVGLGRNLLRAETAAISAMSMIRARDYGLLVS